MEKPRYAIIIPACNEEECLGAVLGEILALVPAKHFSVTVGVNGSSDGTAEVARRMGVLVAEVPETGYGHGCQAAIDRLETLGEKPQAYVFVAGDGANDPRDISALVNAHQRGYEMVLGCRTTDSRNRRVMGWTHVFANRILGLWCSVLSGRLFNDIGPLRLIDRRLFKSLRLQDRRYGWTIEAQIKGALAKARVCEVAVRERPRIGGVQKVSRVSALHTLRIGLAIVAAGWRARWRGNEGDEGPNQTKGAVVVQRCGRVSERPRN